MTPNEIRALLKEHICDIASPGDTVFIRFDRALSAQEAHSIHHIMGPVARDGGIRIVLVDRSGQVEVRKAEPD